MSGRGGIIEASDIGIYGTSTIISGTTQRVTLPQVRALAHFLAHYLMLVYVYPQAQAPMLNHDESLLELKVTTSTFVVDDSAQHRS